MSESEDDASGGTGLVKKDTSNIHTHFITYKLYCNQTSTNIANIHIFDNVELL